MRRSATAAAEPPATVRRVLGAISVRSRRRLRRRDCDSGRYVAIDARRGPRRLATQSRRRPRGARSHVRRDGSARREASRFRRQGRHLQFLEPCLDRAADADLQSSRRPRRAGPAAPARRRHRHWRGHAHGEARPVPRRRVPQVSAGRHRRREYLGPKPGRGRPRNFSEERARSVKYISWHSTSTPTGSPS